MKGMMRIVCPLMSHQSNVKWPAEVKGCRGVSVTNKAELRQILCQVVSKITVEMITAD